jgi:SAM-dependent methyltransferase
MDTQLNFAPYDIIAEEYYDMEHKTSRNFDQTTVEAFRGLKDRVPDTGLVLDVGAGKGRCNEYLGIDTNRIIQLDSSRRMLQLKPRENCLFRIKHRAESLPFLDSEFSCVSAFLCDSFLGLNFLSEAYRVLSKNGMLIGTAPSYEWGVALREEIQIEASITRFITKNGNLVTVPSILVPLEQLREMLIVVGFNESNIQVERHRLPQTITEISPDISLPAKKLGYDVYELIILYSFVARK